MLNVVERIMQLWNEEEEVPLWPFGDWDEEAEASVGVKGVPGVRTTLEDLFDQWGELYFCGFDEPPEVDEDGRVVLQAADFGHYDSEGELLLLNLSPILRADVPLRV